MIAVQLQRHRAAQHLRHAPFLELGSAGNHFLFVMVVSG